MQMMITVTMFCEFIVWTKKDFFYQRIQRNDEFLTSETKKAQTFFFKVILPELLGKYFTSRKFGILSTTEPMEMTSEHMETEPSTSSSDVIARQSIQRTPDIWCYCRRPEEGRMICCENKNCIIQWFHKKCIENGKVNGKWICRDCVVSSGNLT